MRLTLLLLCCLVQSVTWAGELPKPVGKPILTIYGNIENTNENGKAVFDLASLEKLGVVSFETTSPWYNGRTKFEGVPMNKLMDYVGAKGTKEGANKQVISSQADSLIKISRIWADFFPANTSNQPI